MEKNMKTKYDMLKDLLLALSIRELRVLLYVLEANKTEFICTKGAVMTMSECIGYSRQTISNTVNSLHKKGFLVRKEYGSRNEYKYSEKLFD